MMPDDAALVPLVPRAPTSSVPPDLAVAMVRRAGLRGVPAIRCALYLGGLWLHGPWERRGAAEAYALARRRWTSPVA